MKILNFIKAFIRFLKDYKKNPQKIFNEVAEQQKKLTELAETNNSLTNYYNDLRNKINESAAILDTFTSVIEAHNQRIRNQENLKLKENFNKIALSSSDIEDIKLIKETLEHMNNKEILNKLIWKEYYEEPAKAMLSRLGLTKRVTGIYRITSITTGKCYIGQSVNIGDRFKTHIKSSLGIGSSTNKFYETAKAEGIENFTFEILQECEEDKTVLNKLEKYWIDFYDSKNIGLNSTSGGS